MRWLRTSASDPYSDVNLASSLLHFEPEDNVCSDKTMTVLLKT